MNIIHSAHTLLHRGLLYPARFDVPHLPEKKPKQTDGDALAKQLVFRPIPPNDRTTKDWTAVAWPTNIQSGIPDGKFGPGRMLGGDCWFVAALGAVANDPVGHKILAKSIKKADGGYDITFRGLPHNTVFISDSELNTCLEACGGDADTRLMELAADKFFSKRGNFKSVFIAANMRTGMNQARAEQCLQDYCGRYGIQDPMTYNPMRSGIYVDMAFFMFTGMLSTYCDVGNVGSGIRVQSDDVMRFLNHYVTNDRDGASITISGLENPLGDNRDARDLVLDWDMIRTEITSHGTLYPQQRAFLNALDKWLETRISYALQALKSAAGNLNLEHSNPVDFVNTLARNLFNMNQDHFNVLQSGVREVLNEGLGYIGFTGDHTGTIEGINAATNTFTYSEPNNPTVVHTGTLSRLIQAILSENVYLNALKPTTEQEERERFEHAGTSRGRRLRQIHNRIVRDGKIDQTESGPLANLMEMDDSTFRQVYDSDKNGVIEGHELKAVQLRVNQWIDHLESTPIWKHHLSMR